MTGRTHDLAAFATLSLVTVMYPPSSLSLPTLLLALLANQVGGIAPDIDQPTAPFWRNLPVGNIFGKVFGRLSGGHRYLTHSIVGLILFGLATKSVLVFLQPLLGSIDSTIVWIAFMIGMVSHVALDSLTKEGVPLFLPLPYRVGIPPVKRLRIVTGQKIEKLLIFPGLLIACFYMYGSFSETFLRLLRSINP